MTQHNRETLLALAKRCEKATGPSFELFAEAFEATYGGRHLDLIWLRFNWLLEAEAWLDAAMSLRPEGRRWVLRQATADECKGAFFCRLESGDFKSIAWGKGANISPMLSVE